ncbi:MAG: aldo/keto reductase [Deltaproteobacteria bacterium]|nr:aldo/keto reductase [Deltaproteobacteria bacterium]
MIDIQMNRRTFIMTTAAAAAGTLLTPERPAAQSRAAIQRVIPSSGERLPVIGMGTSETFDAGSAPDVRAGLTEVLKAFFENGGTVIDSSPMYGKAEAVVGELLKAMHYRGPLFAATKVWIDGKNPGIEQMQTSMRLMGVDVMDLMQIHNLRDWKTHLPTLRKWKEQGKIRYIGITTSHGRSHTELEQIMLAEPLDFVQFSYSLDDRRAEERLLPLAADRGIATLINRPFERGGMFRKVKGKPLPEWSAEFDCRTWAQFFLKFILAHPAVTCIIPATAKLKHMQDNMGAGFGRLPDANLRGRMLEFYNALG